MTTSGDTMATLGVVIAFSIVLSDDPLLNRAIICNHSSSSHYTTRAQGVSQWICPITQCTIRLLSVAIIGGRPCQAMVSGQVHGGRWLYHHGDVIMSAMASQITGVSIVYPTGPDQRKNQSSASLAFVRGIHRSPTGEFPTQRASSA